MSDSSDTSTIDDKQAEQSTSTTDPNYVSNVVSFVLKSIILFIIIVVYFGIGGGGLLYISKLAQSNILPTDSKCFPYTDTNPPNIQEIKSNIFTTFTDPPQSMKIQFLHNNYNFTNKFLDMFLEYKNSPSSHFLANYMISIFESLIEFNYNSINLVGNMLNDIPEVITVIFGPAIFLTIILIVSLLNNFYFIYLWFANMGWFFKKNINDSGEGRPKWEPVNLVSFFDYFMSWGLVFLFIILFFVLFGFFPIIAAIFLIYCIFSCLLYQSELNGKKASIFTISQDILKYYKVTIMSIFSFIVVINAFLNLGTVPGVFSLLTLGLILGGIISIDIFKPINPENLSAVLEVEQAKKKCVYKQALKEKGGLLDLFTGGGKKLTKQLKSIHKNFQK